MTDELRIEALLPRARRAEVDRGRCSRRTPTRRSPTTSSSSPTRASRPTGAGRVGDIDETTLGAFADTVAQALPATARGVLVGGDPDRVVRRVAVTGGAGDFLLDRALASGADVYVTSDLRHHVAGEFLEKGGPSLLDVSHWAAEWTWLPELATRLGEALGDTVEIRVSTLCTDVWQARR